ncbi:MAG: hypothetical protein HZA58_01070 [Acidimicrobiia bacterium]|nr:hypothetical protein [Acidimicrobiia bacterium]
MGERVVQIILIVLAVVVAFTVLGWLLRALWWIALIAGGVVLGGLILGKISKS